MLAAVYAIVLTLENHPSAPKPSVSVERRSDRVVVKVGDGVFTEYRFEGDTKPYLYPILAPGDLHVTRRWPAEEVEGEERDHPHHRGSWFAHGAVNGFDFWTGEQGRSRIVVGKVEDPEGPTIRLHQTWKHDDDPILEETRAMTFSATETSRTIDFEITLTPSDRDVVFGDTKEGTFALRLAETLRLKGPRAKGRARNSEGVEGGEIWGRRARFVEYAGPADSPAGVELSVAIYDHPSNPRHPTWWHARDYGLFAANPFGVHDFEKKPAGTGDLILKRGDSITFRYRLVIATGGRSMSELEENAPKPR